MFKKTFVTFFLFTSLCSAQQTLPQTQSENTNTDVSTGTGTGTSTSTSTAQQTSDEIGVISTQVLGSLSGGWGGGGWNNGRTRRLSPAETRLMNLQGQRLAWQIRREALEYRIQRATFRDRVRLYAERARADIMQAEAEYEASRELYLERRETRDAKIETAILEAEFALTTARSKLQELERQERIAMEERRSGEAVKALQDCAAKPVAAKYLVYGHGVELLTALARNVSIAGPACKERPDHWFTENSLSELRHHLAFATPEGKQLGKYYSPFLQINPAARAAIARISDSRLKGLAETTYRDIEILTEKFYRASPSEMARRQSIVRQLLEPVNSLEALTDDEDLMYYSANFRKELGILLAVSQPICSAYEQVPVLEENRDEMQACLTLIQPTISDIGDFNSLLSASRLRLCPSRELLTSYSREGTVHSVNARCVSPEDSRALIHAPILNQVCMMDQLIQSCAISEGAIIRGPVTQ